SSSPAVFLLIVNLILLFIGMFMETNGAVLITGPLLAPAAAAFGIDPVHFGIILVTNLELGLMTPPLAANLYVAAKTTQTPLAEMVPFFGWFLVAGVIVLLSITYIPTLTVWHL